MDHMVLPFELVSNNCLFNKRISSERHGYWCGTAFIGYLVFSRS